jgi:hypothetical protein
LHSSTNNGEDKYDKERQCQSSPRRKSSKIVCAAEYVFNLAIPFHYLDEICNAKEPATITAMAIPLPTLPCCRRRRRRRLLLPSLLLLP